MFCLNIESLSIQIDNIKKLTILYINLLMIILYLLK